MAQLPVFETTRLILRDITERDASAYERHFVDYDVIGTMSHIVPWPYPENGVLEYIRTTVIPKQCLDRWVWAICLQRTDYLGARLRHALVRDARERPMVAATLDVRVHTKPQ